MIFLLSGPLGVGKSTTSRELARNVEPCVLIEGDNILHMFKSRTISYLQYNCPYQDELSKEAIQSMISFTPQRIAMFVMSNPDDENIQLQKSVDLYVKKLNF